MPGLCRLYRGHPAEALADLVRVPELGNRSAWPLAKQIAARAALGERAEARRLLDEILERSRSEFMTPSAAACGYCHCGESDQALAWLDRAAEGHDSWLPFIGIEPLFAPLHGDPRFAAFCARNGVRFQPVATHGVSARSLVVLPFENASPDPDNAYFADGLTEELIADLSKVRELKVIARNSAMRLKGTTKDARTLGRELNVRYVLGGSVRKAGQSLRITAQLSDAADDSQVWAEKYSGTMDDVFELQERLSRQIVGALKLLDRRRARSPGGPAERACPAVARLLSLDPLSYGAHVSVGIAELMAGRYPEALAGFEAGLEFEPDSFDLRIFQAWGMTACGSMPQATDLYWRLADEASRSGPGVADWCRVCASGAADRDRLVDSRDASAPGLLGDQQPVLDGAPDRVSRDGGTQGRGDGLDGAAIREGFRRLSPPHPRPVAREPPRLSPIRAVSSRGQGQMGRRRSATRRPASPIDASPLLGRSDRAFD